MGKALDANTIIMTNTVGMKMEHQRLSTEEYLEVYREQSESVGIPETCIQHDGSEAFGHHFARMLTRIEELGLLTEGREDISWCTCGRIEIPTQVLQKLVQQNRAKTLIKHENGIVRCKVCDSKLSSKKETVRMLQLPMMSIPCAPLFYGNEVVAVAERISSHPIIVSRNHRGKDVVFDTDFRWFSYLSMIRGDDTDVVLVTSPTTLNQAVKVVATLAVLSPETRCSLCVHPLVRVRDGNMALSSSTLKDVCQLLPSAFARRMLIALGLQWTNKETVVSSKEVHLISQTVRRPIEKMGDMRISVQETTETFMKLCNRNRATKLLKEIRAGQVMDTDLLGLLCSI
jgi:hypothetical protein